MVDGIHTPQAAASPGPLQPAADPSTAAIRVRDFNLWYGDFQALFNVDIDVSLCLYKQG